MHANTNTRWMEREGGRKEGREKKREKDRYVFASEMGFFNLTQKLKAPMHQGIGLVIFIANEKKGKEGWKGSLAALPTRMLKGGALEE